MEQSFRVEIFCVLILFHQSQAIPFADESDLLLWVEVDGAVKVEESLFVRFGFQVQLSAVDVGFVVLGKLLEALFQLNINI